jgi:mRNA interferase HigB
MRIVAKSNLVSFCELHSDSKIGLLTWYEKISKHNFDSPQQVILNFKDADYIGNNRIVFNIAKNKYRLIVSFNFNFQAGWIKFIGTHKAYDNIDAKTIEMY